MGIFYFIGFIFLVTAVLRSIGVSVSDSYWKAKHEKEAQIEIAERRRAIATINAHFAEYEKVKAKPLKTVQDRRTLYRAMMETIKNTDGLLEAAKSENFIYHRVKGCYNYKFDPLPDDFWFENFGYDPFITLGIEWYDWYYSAICMVDREFIGYKWEEPVDLMREQELKLFRETVPERVRTLPYDIRFETFQSLAPKIHMPDGTYKPIFQVQLFGPGAEANYTEEFLDEYDRTVREASERLTKLLKEYGYESVKRMNHEMNELDAFDPTLYTKTTKGNRHKYGHIPCNICCQMLNYGNGDSSDDTTVGIIRRLGIHKTDRMEHMSLKARDDIAKYLLLDKQEEEILLPLDVSRLKSNGVGPVSLETFLFLYAARYPGCYDDDMGVECRISEWNQEMTHTAAILTDKDFIDYYDD